MTKQITQYANRTPANIMAVQDHMPTAEQFSVLLRRVNSGESAALDLRNNITLDRLANGAEVVSNRNGDFTLLGPRLVHDAEGLGRGGHLYEAVRDLLIAEFCREPVAA